MNENAFVAEAEKTVCQGAHEYQTRDGKELVCRRCNYVYSPLPLPGQLFKPAPPTADQIADDALAAAKAVLAVLPLPDPGKIENHEGKKYLRTIRSAVDPSAVIRVDVYAVIEAFGITCPAQQHALKKCLAAGQRGKGTVLKDLQGAIDALHRAIELQQQREITPSQ